MCVSRLLTTGTQRAVNWMLSSNYRSKCSHNKESSSIQMLITCLVVPTAQQLEGARLLTCFADNFLSQQVEENKMGACALRLQSDQPTRASQFMEGKLTGH